MSRPTDTRFRTESANAQAKADKEARGREGNGTRSAFAYQRAHRIGFERGLVAAQLGAKDSLEAKGGPVLESTLDAWTEELVAPFDVSRVPR